MSEESKTKSNFIWTVLAFVVALPTGIYGVLQIYDWYQDNAEQSQQAVGLVEQTQGGIADNNPHSPSMQLSPKISTYSEAKGIVYASIAKVMKVSELNIEPSMSFYDDFENIDSLHLVELIIEVEERSGCSITDDVAMTVKTVSDLQQVIMDACGITTGIKNY